MIPADTMLLGFVPQRQPATKSIFMSTGSKLSPIESG